MNVNQGRPVFLDLHRIRQPVNAVVSILHRISGILMVMLLPGMIYLLQLSLSSPEGFSQVISLLGHQATRVVAIVLCWVFAHHLLAGIRFLLLDFDIGITREVARITAWVVHFGAALTALLVAGVVL